MARSLTTLVILLCCAIPTFIGCGDDDPSEEGYFEEGVAKDTASSELRIVKGGHGPDFPDLRLTVLHPAADEVVAAGDSVMVQVEIQGGKYELMSPTPNENEKGIAFSKEGQHIHVIIDDKPYMAMYKKEGFSVGMLPEGVHTLRAFPSRSWHESIKNPNAFRAHTFYVGAKSGQPVLDPVKPLLTYSRPKGEYKGDDANRILLDFYVANAELGPDKHKVVATIDDKLTDTLTEWIPYYIEGLKEGEHTVNLKLIGPDGAVVANGPFNDVTQTITVAKAAKEGTASTETPQEEKDMHDAMRHSKP